MKTLHVFDMDGTLFDTFKATKLAYEEAGLTEYRQEYFGKTFTEWECPAHIHFLKQSYFHKFRHHIKEAWAMPFYKTFSPQSFILTGASAETVEACRLVNPKVELRNPYGYQLNHIQKRRVLKSLSDFMGYEVFYYDDLPDVGSRIVNGLDKVKLITEGDLL